MFGSAFSKILGNNIDLSSFFLLLVWIGAWGPEAVLQTAGLAVVSAAQD